MREAHHLKIRCLLQRMLGDERAALLTKPALARPYQA